MLKKIYVLGIWLLFLGIITINILLLMEAYSPSAPYYSMTTNLDKWVNPWPMIIVMDIAALGIYFFIRPTSADDK